MLLVLTIPIVRAVFLKNLKAVGMDRVAIGVKPFLARAYATIALGRHIDGQ